MRMASVRDKGEPMKGDAPTKTNNVVYERAIFFSERFIIKREHDSYRKRERQPSPGPIGGWATAERDFAG